MSMSDEEEEFVPDQVSRYYFVDENEDPVSFAVLPFQWSDGQKTGGTDGEVVLHGIADSGQHKVYKPVIAWKLELSAKKPTMFVLSKDEKIELSKPRPSYEEMIRSALIMVHALHFGYSNPNASEKELWDYLLKTFSIYEPEPSDDDLREHRSLIREIIQRDEVLKNSKVAQLLVEDTSTKSKSVTGGSLSNSGVKKRKFIVDGADDGDGEDLGDSESNSDDDDEEPDLFDSVCAICDNGGDLLCCDGCCLRGFHAISESDCPSLGLSKAEVKAIRNFYCGNCKYKQHQCFVCGKLGSSDKSSNPEVFQCVSATCGHFYHPSCVVGWLYPDNEADAQKYEKKIAAGEPFTCPVHKCIVCKQGEDKENKEMQFAICRRCPKAYHRKCLPREISFEDEDDEDIIQRAWDDLLPNRVLIYCLEHEIDEELGTPARDHLIFPEESLKRKVHPPSHEQVKEKSALKKRKISSEGISQGKSTVGALQKKHVMTSTIKGTESPKKIVKALTVKSVDSVPESKMHDVIKKSRSSAALKMKTSTLDNGDKVANSTAVKPLKQSKKNDQMLIETAPVEASSKPIVDSEAEKRVVALIDKCKSAVTLRDVQRKLKVPSIYAHGSTQSVTYGKVEGSIEAIKAALTKLEEGGSIEDAKAVCETRMLNQIIKWKTKLRVYLAPFIHGARYTSFGRHFTKVSKLEEIVEMLHWYIKTGDTIVDFCCGANSFSRLLKDKLEETGKKCSFKNFDIIRPTNDFDFERRDWMSVERRELPTGSRLIIGLNPPFGVKAAIANRFIDKALEFRPKLIAFYLPGSVDVEDQSISQWNTKPPVLYLWSRPDWTSKHRSTASKQGHTSKSIVQVANSNEKNVQTVDTDGEKFNLYDTTETSVANYKKSPVEVAIKPEKQISTLPPNLKGSSRFEHEAKDKHQGVMGEQERKNVEKVKNDRSIAYQVSNKTDKAMKDIIISDEERKHADKAKSNAVTGGQEKKSMDKTWNDRVTGDQENKSVGKGWNDRVTVVQEGMHADRAKSDKVVGGRESKNKDKAKNDGVQGSKSMDNSSRIILDKGKKMSEKASHLSDKHVVDRPEKQKRNRDHRPAGLPSEVTESTSVLKEKTSEAFRSPNTDAREEMHEFRFNGSSRLDTETRSTVWQNNARELDDIERRYSRNDKFPPAATSNWGSPSTHGFMSGREPEYRHHSSEDRYRSFPMGNSEETYGASTMPRPYIDDLDEKYGRPGLDARLNVRLYGQPGQSDFVPRRSAYPMDQERTWMDTLPPPSAFGPSDPSAPPSYNQSNSSTIQRYAPRLDELNYSRQNMHTPEPPFSRGGTAYGSMTEPGSQGGFQRHRLDYSTAPPRSFPGRDSSCGWLDE
ncbi:ENHANCED DOWNY MILDEW 2 protein [Nymphaea thermarum]|nr:ENHANCED DOWNY MILDEW 2 protein [Nymphaea thermarum]